MLRGAQVAEAGEQLRAGRAWRRTASGPGRFTGERLWLAGFLAAVGLVVAGALSVLSLPVAVTFLESGDGWVIDSLGVGTDYWAQGARPGAPVELRSVDGALQYMLSTTNGSEAGVVPDPPQSPIYVLGGTFLAGLAFLLRRSRLPGTAALLGTGVAFALSPAGPQLGLPVATPLFLLPAATAALAVYVPNRRWQLAFDAVSLVALALTLGLVLALMPSLESRHWTVIWALPLAIALGVGVVGELFAIRARLGQMPPTSDGSLKRILSATVPLANDSRLEGAEDERARIAIDIHNRLLPHVETSVRSIKDAGLSPDEAADQLDELAAALRGVMQRNQTVSLEIGGVAEALKADVAAMDKRGVFVAFVVRGNDTARPPARVELAAYRIGQAAIDNALRHSGGDRVEVTLTAERDRLDLTISDDGVGVDGTAEGEARQRGRIGLAQMRLRAEAVGATVDIKGRPGAGTTIHFLWVG
jgi:signal transduction histidine kinase